MPFEPDRKEIEEALRDWPRYQRKTARDFLGYAVLLAVLGVFLPVEIWLMRHKLIDRFSRNPIQVLLILGGMAYGFATSLFMSCQLLMSRRDTLRHAKQMEYLKARREQEDIFADSDAIHAATLELDAENIALANSEEAARPGLSAVEDTSDVQRQARRG